MFLGLHDFVGAVLAVVFEGFGCFDDGVGAGGSVALEAGEGLLLFFSPGERAARVHQFGFHFGELADTAFFVPFGFNELVDHVGFGVVFGVVGFEPGGL